MTSPLGILLLEDDLGDAQLIQDIFEEDAFPCEITRVQTRLEFVTALENGSIDLILADYRLPAFDGLSALRIVLENRPEVPFIFVSGLLGEEVAIEALKIGATDYVLKTGLSRLVPAVQRALREAEEKLERKKAEDALRESERRSRSVIDGIPGFVAILAPDGNVEVVNRQIVEYCGRPLAELKNWGTNGTVHHEDLPHVAEIFTRSITYGVPYQIEQRLRRFDGEYRWFDNRGIPVRDAQGRIACWYVLLTDIEDRKRAEESLRRSERFLAEAQRISLTGSFSWQVATDEITWSEQVYRIFGFDQGVRVTLELIGSRVHPEDIPMLYDMIDRARGAGSDFEYEHRLVMPDGSVKYLHTAAHGNRDRDGRLEYIGAVQDVTEHRLSEEALSKLRSELAHIARVTSLGALTASIAHEVNQPLSGIITNASTCLRMLAADPPNLDGARATAQRTLRDGNRASEVIQHLRAMFERKQRTTETVDLNDAAREVLALSSSELQGSRVILRTDFDEGLPAVTGDRVQLQQVILNLILNAADAMRTVDDRPRVLAVATARQDEDRIRLSVRDSGVGIDPQNFEKLFEAFYTTKSHGMGIGLSISRSIIESHEGRIWASANYGPGATFSFSIPCKSEPAPGLEEA